MFTHEYEKHNLHESRLLFCSEQIRGHIKGIKRISKFKLINILG